MKETCSLKAVTDENLLMHVTTGYIKIDYSRMKMCFTSFLITVFLLSSFSFTRKLFAKGTSDKKVEVAIDLINVHNDRVQLTLKPTLITTSTVSFQLPRIIPGTYSIADYGRYIDEFSATDRSGKQLTAAKKDANTWVISDAAQLYKVTYLVNDTYDSETGTTFTGESTTIFSPAGTNILEGKQFMLNMAGFVGYFENQKNIPYVVKIIHPAGLVGTSAMDDLDNSETVDLFHSPRFADLVDSPIMYAAPDVASFIVDKMKVVLHVYSPVNKQVTAAALMPDLQKMMTAQKKFLGKINRTPKYAVLVYVTSSGKEDASGIGALEHNTSTTAVFMETMTSEDLIHVISHEFFHTLTPLNVHSKEIQDFDFNNPKMSAHLWLYEGITEYFANLFQVNQGLIAEDAFLNEMASKEQMAKKMYPNDISFTVMSRNILDPEMKKVYPNVYQKGALLAMCIDLLIREKSNGKKGILDMMRKLSKIYGPHKPFDDAELIPVVTRVTYPEVGDFIQKYIVSGETIDYLKYLEKAGIERTTIKTPVQIALIVNDKKYLKIDTLNKQVLAVVPDTANVFVNAMGLQNDDIILEINDHKLDASDIISVVMGIYKLQEEKPMVIKVSRKGQMIELKGNVKLNYIDTPGFRFANPTKEWQKERWLKG
jgi:predicted metalloprotease with PDZ domain